MLPGMDFMPPELYMELKREDLMREFESMRLVRAASLSNPGWLDRAYMRLGQFMMKTGERLYEKCTAPRPIYTMTSAKYAA